MHSITIRHLLYTWIALMLLAGLTFGLGFRSLGASSPLIAMLIASAKALLVILFFMELFRSRLAPRAALLLSLLLLGILMGIALIDVATRHPPALPPG